VRHAVATQSVDLVFESILRRLRSEVIFVDVDVAEQEETVRAVAAAVVDRERVTAEFRRRDCVGFLGVDVVAMAGEEELQVEGHETREAGFVEPLGVDLRLGLREEVVVTLPENLPLWSDGFEALAILMVCEFTGELVEAVEVGVEVIAGVVRPDETTVAESLYDTVDRIVVIVVSVGDLGDGSRPVEIVEHLEGLAGRQPGELGVRVLADEVLVTFAGASIQRHDAFSPPVASV